MESDTHQILISAFFINNAFFKVIRPWLKPIKVPDLFYTQYVGTPFIINSFGLKLERYGIWDGIWLFFEIISQKYGIFHDPMWYL